MSSLFTPDAVIQAIRVSGVPYPFGHLMEWFISSAAETQRAASHFMSRCSTAEGTIAKATVDDFLRDWQELIQLCMWRATTRSLLA